MKAYKAYDAGSDEQYSTIVFAETAREAKNIARNTETCEEAKFTDIRVYRLPQADGLYRGRPEMDWYDMRDRVPLVRDLGWACLDMSWECDGCPAKQYCSWFEDEREDLKMTPNLQS